MPPYEALVARDRRLALERREAALEAAERALAALAEAGIRALVAGSLAGARRFRKDSDLDLLVLRPADPEAARALVAGLALPIPADVAGEAELPPRIVRTMLDHSLDAPARRGEARAA